MQRDGVGAAMLAEHVGGQRLVARRALGLLLLHDELPDAVLTAVAAALPYGARTPRHRALAILGAPGCSDRCFFCLQSTYEEFGPWEPSLFAQKFFHVWKTG